MVDSDPTLLRSAATGAGIDQLPDGSFAAVSSFDSGSRSLVDPIAVNAANRPSLKSQVEEGLNASGQTYYDLAFSRANEQLDAMPGADKRALVFLSDGAPNGGDYTDELDAIRQAGIPVFAIGFFSAPGAVLAEIAASTGGQAYTVQSPGEAQAVFARIVSTLTCDATQVRENVTLQPGETRAFPYTIGPSDREFRALAAWSFNGVTVRLRRPDGSFLAPGAELAGERFISEETYASVVGRNPVVGGWELQVTAAASNVDEVNVSIDIFRRTSADPPDAFTLAAPADGTRISPGPVTFSWNGARNAESYELEIDDVLVRTGLPRDPASMTLEAVPPGTHTWRIAAVNQFGRTLSERRVFGPPGYKYVAIGDSFSAGQGVEEYFEPTNGCHRSKRAYSTLIERPGLAGASMFEQANARFPGIDWGFQACSGARTPGVTDTPGWGDAFAQLDLNRAADPASTKRLPVDALTDLVTITIGGNDLEFASLLTFCALSKNCTTEKYKGTCSGKEITETLAKYSRCKRDELSPRLDAIYARIHAQAPKARIIVAGYPQLFPESAKEQNCFKIIQRTIFNPRDRKKYEVGFSHTEQNALREETSRANQLIAARVQASGVATFVAVDRYFAGREICGKEKVDWINAATPSLVDDGKGGKTIKPNDQSFHPNEHGHRGGYALAINEVLNPGVSRIATSGPALVRVAPNGSVTLGGSRVVSCPSGGVVCKVSTEARARVPRASGSRKRAAAALIRIGGSRFTVAPRHSKAVRLRLTRSGRLALRRKGRQRATVTITAQRGKSTSTRTVTITFVASRRR
jgi:lysophospholipase L1-like esterase